MIDIVTTRYLLAASALGRLIRDARARAGLTQAELADHVHTTQSAVSRWESGRDEPRLSTVRAVLSACGSVGSLVVDDGIDRAQIAAHVELSPADRLRSVSNVNRLMAAATRQPESSAP